MSIDFEELGRALASSHEPNTVARMTKALRQLAADVLEEAAKILREDMDECEHAASTALNEEHKKQCRFAAACFDITLESIQKRAASILKGEP